MAAIVKNLQGSYTVRTGIDVSGSELNDTIVNGAYPEDSLVGANSIDEYKGHNISISGNEGKDVILNHGYNVTVSGGDGNDSIRNFGSNVRISGNEGSDKFIISGASENNTITDFTEGEDELWFEQGAVTAEIDTYYTKHSVVIKSAETGDTLVRLEGVTSGSSNKIVWYKDDGGTMSTNINWLLANSATTDSDIKNITVKANGKLNNTLDNAIITATTGNNSIQNSGNKITINGGSGNDTIKNSGSDVKINGNDGDDSVNNNGGNNVTIDGVKGSDTVFNSGNDVSIFGGEGKDSIRINAPGTKVTVDGGDDDDDINNSGSSALISGSAGNDYLSNHGDNSTINGGTGDDAIHNSGTSVLIFGGTGNDEISNTGDNVTIDAGEGNDSIDNIGSNVSIYSGDGADTITNRGTNATNITINSGNGDDSISNLKSNVTITSGSGDDTIYNDGSNVLIDSGTGNDSIHNRAGSNITFNYRNGDGNDTIDGLKEFPTINISGGSYSSLTSGDDVILKIGDGSITLRNAKGATLTVIGTYKPDTIPPDNPPDEGGNTSTTYKTQQDIIKTFMKSLDETKETNWYNAVSEAISLSSGGFYNDLTNLIERFFLDYHNIVKFGENSIIEESAYKFLQDCCGINLNNNDTGAITGFDTNGSKIQKNAQDIVLEDKPLIKLDELSENELKNLPDIISTNPLTFVKNGLEVVIPNKDSLSSKQKNIINGLYSWWIESALNLIEISYGLTFNKNEVHTITFINPNTNLYNFTKNILGSKTLAAVQPTSSGLELFINEDWVDNDLNLELNHDGKSETLKNESRNNLKDNFTGTELETEVEKTVNGYLLDRILAHEFTHGIMAAKMVNYQDFPKYIKEGFAELTTGADDTRNFIEALNNETKLYNTFYNHAHDILPQIPIIETEPYSGGFMLWRYFVKQVSDNSKFPIGVYYHNPNRIFLMVTSPFSGTIDLATYPSTIKHIYATENPNKLKLIGNATDNEIWSSKSGSEVLGERGNDTLHGNDGEDTLNGGKDDDTLTGGNGSDTFVYASGDGNDVFIDITSKDKIKLTSGTIDSWSINGTDVIFKIGSGSITAKNARGKNITIINSSGTETTKKYDSESQEDIRNKPLEINPVVLQEIRNSVVRSNANAAENSNPTYVTNEGEITDSSQDAVLKLEVINNTLVQTALNARPQIYALGSTQDAMDWVVNTSSGDDSITSASNKNSTVSTGAGNDTIVVSGTGNVYANAGSGNDFVQITSNAKGKTTVEGGKGSDTINNSGASNVLFKYTAGDGNDLITGFNSTSTLSIAGAKYSSNVSGDDLIFSVGKEKITLVGANNLSTVNITGIPNTTQPATTAPDTTTAETTTLIITDSTESRVTLKSAVKTVDASSRTTAVKITGNSNANSIVGGSGDDAITGKAGKDTLDGRTGDDTLTGGSGSDLFIYSTGNDVITDYSTGDKVSLATAIASSSLNGSDVILTTKNGSLTIQNSKGKTLNLIDSAGKSYSTIIGGSSSETSLPVNQNTNQNHTQNNSSSTSTTINSGSSTSTVTANSSSSVSSSSNAPVISYIYTGGDQVIDNYISEQKTALGTLPNGYIFGGGNFALTSDNGTLFIQNAYDKVIDFVDGTGNPFAKAYAATNPGVIDGRGIAGFEVIAGSDLGSDFIFAGDGSSSLWGGNGSDSDTLVGGGGTDIFLGSKYAGNDIFVNASATDLIHLGDVLLSDVIATAEVDNAVAVAFNTGNVIMAGSTEPLSAAFILADGSAYRFNHVTKVWQNA